MRATPIQNLCGVVFGLLIFSSVAFAQEVIEGQDDTDSPPKRQAWIIATSSLPNDVANPVKVLSGKKISEVQLMKRSMGLPVAVADDGMVHLVKPIQLENGKPSFERHVSVKVPDGVRKSLILLAPDPELPAPLKFRAKVIDLDKFQNGDALYVNLTRFEIGVALGKTQTTLGSGKIEVIDVGSFDGTKNFTISYHYRTPGEKEWNLISASTVPLRSTRREILIFSYDRQLGQIDYHGLTFNEER